MPKWRTHRIILEKALGNFNLNLRKDFLDGLFNGIIDPDIKQDKKIIISKKRTYEKEITHHDVHNNLIRYYYELSLYYVRRNKWYFSGLMLGRCLHYIHDSIIKRRKMLIIDAHEEIENELEKLSDMISELCEEKIIKKSSSNPKEIICSAYYMSIDVLRNFFEESSKDIDINLLKEKIRKIRIIKLLILLGFSIMIFYSLVLILLWIIAFYLVIEYKPNAYHEAMKAGLIIVKPTGYKTAY